MFSYCNLKNFAIFCLTITCPPSSNLHDPKHFAHFALWNLTWIFKNYTSSLSLWIIFSSSPWNLLSSYVTNHDNFYVKFNILLICCNFQPASPLLLPASCLIHWHCFLWSTWSQSFFATSSRCKLLEICKTKVSFPIFHKLINFVKFVIDAKVSPHVTIPLLLALGQVNKEFKVQLISMKLQSTFSQESFPILLPLQVLDFVIST